MYDMLLVPLGECNPGQAPDTFLASQGLTCLVLKHC